MAKASATKHARATTRSGNRRTARSTNTEEDDDADETAPAAAAAAAAAPEPAPALAPAPKYNHKKRKVSNETYGDESNGAGAAAAEGLEEDDLVAPQPPPVEGNEHDGHDNCCIQLPERPNLFPVPDTWWMVDLHARPAPTQGATPLVKRCMRSLGWNEAKARRVLRAYRQFLRVKVAATDWNAEILAPSVAVDQMWRQNVLDNGNYAHDCLLLCGGHFVKHDPDGGLDVEARKHRLVATRQALLEVYGDEEGDGEVVDRSATGPWKEVFEGATMEFDEAPANDGDDGNSGEWLSLVVGAMTGGETHLRVRPDARMGSIFAEYARCVGETDPTMHRFVLHGWRREDGSVAAPRALENDADATPRALGIRDGARLTAVSRARGC